MNEDGIALESTSHPRQPWVRRVWNRLRRPQLSRASLECVQIELAPADPRLLNGILNYAAQRRAVQLQDHYNAKWSDVYNTARTNMSDEQIEKEIQAQGVTAPRVTLVDIEGVIAHEHYATGNRAFSDDPLHPKELATLSCLTLCVLVLKNGFTVTGESACASPENFDAARGRKLARQKAVDKVWAFEGYALKERLSRG